MTWARSDKAGFGPTAEAGRFAGGHALEPDASQQVIVATRTTVVTGYLRSADTDRIIIDTRGGAETLATAKVRQVTPIPNK